MQITTIPGTGNRSLSSPSVQTAYGVHPAPFSIGAGVFYGIQRSKHYSDDSLPYNAQIQNEWSYTSTPPCAFLKLTRIPYCYLHIRTSAQKLLAITRPQDALLNVTIRDTNLGKLLEKMEDSSVISHGSNTVKDMYYENTQHYQDSKTGKARRT
jgi:hypothetical protein